MITQHEATQFMIANYSEARKQLLSVRPELFGKTLDNKARKLALRLAGITLPEDMNIAWATPNNWDGYRR